MKQALLRLISFTHEAQTMRPEDRHEMRRWDPFFSGSGSSSALRESVFSPVIVFSSCRSLTDSDHSNIGLHHVGGASG